MTKVDKHRAIVVVEALVEERDALRAEVKRLQERNEELEEIVARIPGVASYVTATLHSAIKDASDTDTAWGKVHRGRAFSSDSQLMTLAQMADEILEE